MLDSTIFHASVMDNQKYIIGYSVMKKTGCEVYNFVSPTLRVLRFTEGEAQWRVGGAIETFRAGDIVVLSNLIKRNIHRLITPHLTYEVFDFYPSSLSSEQLWAVFYQNIHRVIGAGEENAEKLGFLLDCLREEIVTVQDDFQILAVQRLLDLLALELRRHLSDAADACFNASLVQISQSVQYIAEHFAEDLSVADLARRCGYSHGYYSRLFRQYIGMSPVQYLISVRLEHALHLINTQDITVLDAAYQSGFRSSSAFYKAQRNLKAEK